MRVFSFFMSGESGATIVCSCLFRLCVWLKIFFICFDFGLHHFYFICFILAIASCTISLHSLTREKPKIS